MVCIRKKYINQLIFYWLTVICYIIWVIRFPFCCLILTVQKFSRIDVVIGPYNSRNSFPENREFGQKQCRSCNMLAKILNFSYRYLVKISEFSKPFIWHFCCIFSKFIQILYQIVALWIPRKAGVLETSIYCNMFDALRTNFLTYIAI